MAKRRWSSSPTPLQQTSRWTAHKTQQKAQNRWELATVQRERQIPNGQMGGRGLQNFHFSDERAPKFSWILPHGDREARQVEPVGIVHMRQIMLSGSDFQGSTCLVSRQCEIG